MLSTHMTYRWREWIWKAARKRTWTSKAVTSPLCDLKNKSCDPWGQMLKWKTVPLWFLSLVLLTWLTCSISSVTAGKLSGIVFSCKPPTAPPKQSQKCFELPLPFPPSGSSLQLPMALQLGWIFIEVSLIVFWGVCLLVHFLNLSHDCRTLGTSISCFQVFPRYCESYQCRLQKPAIFKASPGFKSL